MPDREKKKLNIYLEAERFVSTLKRNTFDYTEWQRGLFADMSVEDISKRAMKLRAEKRKR